MIFHRKPIGCFVYLSIGVTFSVVDLGQTTGSCFAFGESVMDSNLFSPALFWDVDIQKMSLQKHAGFIVQRVCMLGSMEELKSLREIYGMDQIREVLLQARYLDVKTLHYFSVVFNIPKERFRCFSIQQSKPAHWNF